MEKGLGIGDCWIGGRIVVVRQIDFQANKLSRLHLQEGRDVCVWMEERESERKKCVYFAVERI